MPTATLRGESGERSVKNSKVKRVFAATAVTVAAFAVPMAMAGPAAADTTRPVRASESAPTVRALTQNECIAYLKSKGYKIGPKVSGACDHESEPHGFPSKVCMDRLTAIKVHFYDAVYACSAA